VEDDLFVAALFDQFAHVLTAEWRVSAQQSVGDDAEGPQVDWFAMSLLLHDFWGCVAKGASHCGEYFVGVEHFGDAEIGEDQFRVWRARQVEEIFRLKI
jgi:hypothetical protein